MLVSKDRFDEGIDYLYAERAWDEARHIHVLEITLASVSSTSSVVSNSHENTQAVTFSSVHGYMQFDTHPPF